MDFFSKLRKDKLFELKVQDLVYGGMAISKQDDFVIFIEDAVPGDTGEVQLSKIKKNFAMGKMVKRTHDSPLRIQARCKHFGVCGGCQWQFLNYEEQLKFKEKQVRDSIERIGNVKIPDGAFIKILGCADPWFYRNKMEYSFGTDKNGQLVLGLHLPKSFSQIFDLEECFLQSEMSVKIALAVKKWAREKNLVPFDPWKKTGLLRGLFIREGKNTGEIMVNLEITQEKFSEKESFKKIILENFPKVTSLYLTLVTIQKGSRTKIESKLLAGKATLKETMHNLHFEIAPYAFFQPNTKQAEIMYQKVLEFTEPKPDDIVYDLFCGTGTIGMFFAKTCKKVFGIELNPDAVENARKNAEQNNIKNIEFICGDVGNSLKARNIEKPDIIVIDPPRNGIDPKTLEKILEFAPPKLIYVSCNPTTLARDIQTITQKYTIEKIQPIDLFPQTYHIETIVSLSRQK